MSTNDKKIYDIHRQYLILFKKSKIIKTKNYKLKQANFIRDYLKNINMLNNSVKWNWCYGTRAITKFNYKHHLIKIYKLQKIKYYIYYLYNHL